MKSTNTANNNKVPKILLDLGCVLFSRSKPFKFTSGLLSPVYVDNRLIISHPNERKIIVKALISKIKTKIDSVDVIAGIATGGIPYASWIAEELKLPMVFVRSKPKEHGRGNQVEGALKRGQKVLVVEDLVSAASSSTSVIKALKKLGAIVKDEIAIYTHSLKASENNFKKLNVKLHSLTNTKQVALVAKQKGYLKKEQVKLIEEWIADPVTWGKKMGYE